MTGTTSNWDSFRLSRDAEMCTVHTQFVSQSALTFHAHAGWPQQAKVRLRISNRCSFAISCFNTFFVQFLCGLCIGNFPLCHHSEKAIHKLTLNCIDSYILLKYAFANCCSSTSSLSTLQEHSTKRIESRHFVMRPSSTSGLVARKPFLLYHRLECLLSY